MRCNKHDPLRIHRDSHCLCLRPLPLPLPPFYRSGGGVSGGSGVQLVVTNVHPSTSDSDLRAFLSARVASRSLRSCSVLRKLGVSKEMAFITVNDSDEAQALIDSSGIEMAGRYLVFRLSDRNATRQSREQQATEWQRGAARRTMAILCVESMG